jgi:hypothetical protein
LSKFLIDRSLNAVCCAAQFFENLKIKRFLRVSILSIVFSIVFAVHAQAQTSYLDSLGNSDFGPALWVSGSDSYSVNFTATSDATITQVILNAGNEGSNSQVPSSTLSVGGAVFTFQGWGPTELRSPAAIATRSLINAVAPRTTAPCSIKLAAMR